MHVYVEQYDALRVYDDLSVYDALRDAVLHDECYASYDVLHDEYSFYDGRCALFYDEQSACDDGVDNMPLD